MNKNKKGLTRTILLLVVATLLVACGGKGASASDKILKLAVEGELISLDSLTVSHANSAQVIANFTEGLTTYSASGEIVGAIAESWEVADDQKTYTFKLREATWQDGTPVTAHDFVFAWQKVATLPTAAFKNHLRNFEHAADVIAGTKEASSLGAKAINDNELEIKLSQPTPFLLDLLAFPSFLPVNEAFYNKVGAEDYGTTQETVLANGPFNLLEYNGEQGYKLEKSTTYWDNANVQLEGIEVRVVKEAQTRAGLFKSGEIDQLILNADIADLYKDDASVIKQLQPRMAYFYLSENIADEASPLKNKDFRAAISYSIDKTTITEKVTKDGSNPADYFLPEGLVTLAGDDFRTYSGSYNDLKFNVETAQAHLKAAQSALGTDNLTFELVLSDVESSRKVFENIQAQIEANLPGVTVTLKSLPQASYYSILKEGNTAAASTGWVAGFKDPSTFFEIYQTGDGQNYGKYSNQRFDELIQKTESLESAIDPEKRWNEYVEAEQTLLDDYYLVPLYQQGQLSVVNPSVKELKLSPTIPAIFYKYVTKNA